MKYEGPIYRPPSEADSLLIQATVGCPHNKCTFCMVYKKGPKYRVRPVGEIKRDIDEAARIYGSRVKSLFLPAGNTIAMPTEQLAEVCEYARRVLPRLERITVYGSAQYICKKGFQEMKRLREAGLSRIHVGLESGHDLVLRRIKKGATRQQQIEAGLMVREAGIELSEYVILGIAGPELSEEHAVETASAINIISPDFVRLRTFVPKINTLMLHWIRKGKFKMLGPHGVLREARILIENINTRTKLFSDHYTNYLNLQGDLPCDIPAILATIDKALSWDESEFRPFFIGTQ
ncbi:radical SAM protein [Thermodesulforhabdus norvegica]|uniref:Fe-S oxidoreductase n=1 Tax=Thermodesulforhabdus norvegica TaxID=39841 RepID=A0A1I4SJZ5_9BACT|nr:radical SAM protein [Thermodesulforhabdus norvegica]SFM64747.1 Fe-S oxidoreductase [Thermodesulforhabdus norvegica]